MDVSHIIMLTLQHCKGRICILLTLLYQEYIFSQNYAFFLEFLTHIAESCEKKLVAGCIVSFKQILVLTQAVKTVLRNIFEVIAHATLLFFYLQIMKPLKLHSSHGITVTAHLISSTNKLYSSCREAKQSSGNPLSQSYIVT